MTNVKTANVLFMDGRYGEAVKMYFDGAGDGDAECAHNYAYCLLYGIGTERDPAKAKSYFVFASGRVPEASYNLAVMYLHGIGVKKNYAKSFEYMHSAARGGVIEAEAYLGMAHTLGTLFEPEVVCISLIPFHTPIKREEQFLLEGDADFDEEDDEARCSAVRLDHHSALGWFAAAARHSSDYVEEFSAKSKYLYARCFLDGIGTDFNLKRGNELMLLAAKAGSDEAVYYIRTDAPYMIPSIDDPVLIEKIKKQESLGE